MFPCYFTSHHFFINILYYYTLYYNYVLLYFQAGLVIALPSNTAVCGAILVTNNRLLTAAHCWFDGQNQASLFTVVLGSVTIFTGGTRVQTTDVVMHPNWTPAIVLNDIAVIRLFLPLTLSSTLKNKKIYIK